MIALKLHPALVVPAQTPPPLRELVMQERKKLGLHTGTKPPAFQLDLQLQAPLQPGRPIRFEGTCTPALRIDLTGNGIVMVPDGLIGLAEFGISPPDA